MSLGILAESSQSYSPRLHSWFVGVGAGFEEMFFQNRANLLLTTASALPDEFTLANPHSTDGMLSVFVGHQWHPVTNGRINLFLEYDHFSRLAPEPDGTRSAFGYPPSSSFYSPSPYAYTLEHQALLFGAKVDVARWHHLMPYLEGGVGVSRNAFSDFINPNASNGLSLPINAFPNHVTYDLSYIFGLGLDVLMQRNWLLSFGYRFAQWGDVNSGNVTAIPGGGVLSPIHLSNALYSNQAMMRMSYSFSG